MRTRLCDKHNDAAATVNYPSDRGVEVSAKGEGRRTLLHLWGSGGVTFTVWWTADDSKYDGSQLTADRWVDVTDTCVNQKTGATKTAASWVDPTDAVLDISHLTAGRWRLQVVTADATNDFRATVISGPGTAASAGSALPPGAATDAGGTAYVRSAAAEQGHLVLAAATTMTCCSCYNSGGAKLYLVVCDQVAAPSTGVDPCFPLCEVDTLAAVNWSTAVKCTDGCHLYLSTSPTTYTDPGAVGHFQAWRV